MNTFKLDNEPKITSGFKTPDDYFENLSANITQKLTAESILEKPKVISIFRKRKTILLAIAAVLVLALMIPILYTNDSDSTELDAVTIENYLAEESSFNQDELIEIIEIDQKAIASKTNELENETIEDILATNPNIENLVIEN